MMDKLMMKQSAKAADKLMKTLTDILQSNHEIIDVLNEHSKALETLWQNQLALADKMAVDLPEPKTDMRGE